MLLVVGGAQLSSTLLTAAVGRARMLLSKRAAHLTAAGLAFPPGHAAAAGLGLLGSLPCVSQGCASVKKLWPVLFTAVAVGWSRVHLGVR